MRAARFAAASVTLALTAGMTGCSTESDDRPLIVVTTNILGDIVQEVAADEFEVVTLMPHGADPHSFEISAQEAARMRSADLLVSNGLGLEEGLVHHLDTAASEGVELFVAGDNLEAIAYSDESANGALDPHVWTDPERVVDIVDALTPVLADIEGADAATLAESSENYLAEIAELDAEMTEAFASIPDDRRALVTNHHVFGYLAERFDFRIVGAVIPGGTTLAAPSASDLRDLVAAIDEAGVPTIFAESSQPDRLVQVLASEADRDVAVTELVTESLTTPDEGADSYLAMMRINTERIATGLSL
ncbi:zinc ABC transporter substrate-binding protein AztC [Marisediminicola sp. LYQ134]|uniref:zinc ABC transporter substrate-binding protein AztC n=1 Tax=Marisediminicola sp. LYQ134 TaxID=3391061 RepID=UPI0039837FD3